MGVGGSTCGAVVAVGTIVGSTETLPQATARAMTSPAMPNNIFFKRAPQIVRDVPYLLDEAAPEFVPRHFAQGTAESRIALIIARDCPQAAQSLAPSLRGFAILWAVSSER